MYVGVNKLHLGLLGITEQFVLTMHGIGHILGNLLHSTNFCSNTAKHLSELIYS